MSLEQGQYDEYSKATAAMTSTGDTLMVSPGAPINVVRMGCIFTVAIGSGSLVFQLEKRVLAGSDSNRVTGITGCSLSITAAQGLVGTVHTLEVPNLEINPGEELVVKITTAATGAGTAIVFVHAIPKPFQTGRLTKVTKH